MLLYNDFSEALATNTSRALAIGTFDGMHRGHQTLIKSMVDCGRQLNLETGVLTFDPHPSILAGHHQALLQTIPQRLSSLDSLGVQMAIRQNLQPSFAQFSPREFVDRVLAAMGVKELFVGRDFTFGHNKEGDFSSLQKLCQKRDIRAHQLTTITANGENISSTAIRQALAYGDIKKANSFLGYQYTILGPIVHGAQRGRKLGFPTANIETAQLLPYAGVYSGVVSWDNFHYLAAVHIGAPTTFGATIPTVEAFLIDYPGQEIYGQVVKLELTAFIRPSRHFNSPEAIISQMRDDLASIEKNA